MEETYALKPRFGSPVQTVAGADVMLERFGIANPICGDGNAMVRANPELLARMGSAEND